MRTICCILLALVSLLALSATQEGPEPTPQSASEQMIRFLPALVDLGMVGTDAEVKEWQEILKKIREAEPSSVARLELLQKFLEQIGVARDRLSEGLNSQGAAIGLSDDQLALLKNLGIAWSRQEEDIKRVVLRCLDAARKSRTTELTAEEHALFKDYDAATVAYIEEFVSAYEALVRKTDANIARLEKEVADLQKEIEEEPDEGKRESLEEERDRKQAELEAEKEKRRSQEEFSSGFNLGKFLAGLGLTIIGIITVDGGDEEGPGLIAKGIEMMKDAMNGTETRDVEFEEETGEVYRLGVREGKPSEGAIDRIKKRQYSDDYEIVGGEDSNFGLAVRKEGEKPLRWEVFQIEPFQVIGVITAENTVIPATETGLTSLSELTKLREPTIANPTKRFTLSLKAKFGDKDVTVVVRQEKMVGARYNASLQ